MVISFRPNEPHLHPTRSHFLLGIDKFKLAFFTICSGTILILTPLSDINRGIKWGGRWSQIQILTIGSVIFSMQVLNC